MPVKPEHPQFLRLAPPQQADNLQPQKCHLAPQAGQKCREAETMWYFDAATQRCLQFFYGGCGGNENRFVTHDECQNECAPVQHQALTMRAESSVDELGNAEQAGEVEAERMQGDQPRRLRDDTDDAEESRFRGSNRTVDVQDVATVVPVGALPDLCLLPEQKGSCFGSELKWRYIAETASCLSFMYTGCDANANHFESEESCLRACGPAREEKVCALPASVGSCELAVSKWNFDAKTGECKLFMWTGCGGNLNRFSSREECEALCRAEQAWASEEDVCKMGRESGPCSDAVTQWYYDKEISGCRQFTYGGCRGNGNRFDTREQCEGKCAPKMQALTLIEPNDVCALTWERGPCPGEEPRFFFDKNSGRCRPFVYGGCEGNRNNFHSLLDCEHACGKPENLREERRISLSTQRPGPFHIGEEVLLACHADGEVPILWFKDGQLLVFSIRIVGNTDLSLVRIGEAELADAGEYTCAVGPNGLLSDRMMLKVTDREPVKTICFDQGRGHTCALTVRMKLCDKKRYFVNCCQSCVQAGYPMIIA